MSLRNRFKTIAALSLAALVGLSSQAFAAQTAEEIEVYQAPMHFTFDDKEYAPPEGQEGFIYEGSTYVPLRFVSYSLGKGVRWDSETYTVSIAEPKADEQITISEYKLNAQVKSNKMEKLDTTSLVPSALSAYREQVNYMFDGVKKQPSEDLPGFIINDTLYVPIRFFSESVGKEINWDPETYTVSAKTSVNKPTEGEKSEDPKVETTEPAVGGGGGFGGGAGGGIVTKPSYESLTSDAEAKMNNLKSSCKTELYAIYDEFKQTGDLSLIDKANAAVTKCDSKFDQILNDLSSKLSNNGYDTSVIQTYRDAYEAEKEAEKAKILN
ncbi:copper amine oxidase N-terminal domain-containing protein [Paenibacillus hexagrammi]|uniref:Copper amine oxidase N-terminal domain-containing protein n=1 Tax=Paenibacillus hexagrammi TaxID=2908839 RepID=A0ABY3SL53_9BACL|nr:copper amine oxidase N-terminal domain-containing protein [Paenibacillus sp. YPD9-1]UJF34593.1 copper amine oxidase N-terminal domain-containing protein [Paenibacillus sp. YPD9-1]